MKKIIIQGVKGSFHDIAARIFFDGEALNLVEANSFTELFDRYQEESSIDYGVMAIENTIAGSIMYNYSLLKDSDFEIIGEVLLRIKQNLLVLPGTKHADIEEVHSHPMALAQCREFLNKHQDWSKVEREDTALCAEEISRHKLRNHAAIASDLAAEEYGLEILEEEIETNKRNFTRFFILARKGGSNTFRKQTKEKASICFSLKHKKGSLADVLVNLAARSCNLTKIQSVPILGKEWQYFFFADFILENNDFEDIMKDLGNQVESLQLLGHYTKGEHYDS